VVSTKAQVFTSLSIYSRRVRMFSFRRHVVLVLTTFIFQTFDSHAGKTSTMTHTYNNEFEHRRRYNTLNVQRFRSICLGSCNDRNITYVQTNNSITVDFLSNEILKFDRSIQCTSNSTSNIVHGCSHRCHSLNYGNEYVASINLRTSSDIVETCTINYKLRE
jgi:hypothetical protein